MNQSIPKSFDFESLDLDKDNPDGEKERLDKWDLRISFSLFLYLSACGLQNEKSILISR